MIITRLNGGLGNQMFQYAAGRCLAYTLNTGLKLDLSLFRQDKTREYSLSAFSITGDIASAADLSLIGRPLPWMIRHPAEALQSIIKQNTPVRYVKERQFHFDPDILALPDNVYLEGYWQSEKYFSAIEPIIRNEFQVRSTLSPDIQELSRRIRNSNAISIHIRRGDYVKDPVTNATHGVCPASYYQRAREKIIRDVDDPYFWIFSDDPAWVRENITTSHPFYCISDHNFKNFEDLYLMSCCQHHIIANSSFSWWGAYLGSHPGKIVIAPKKWFEKAEKNTKDLLPESWIRL
jgi:hypothetical protein